MVLGDAVSPAVSVHQLLTGWQTDPLSFVALAVQLVLASWYLIAVRRLGLRGRRWSPWRTASFLGATLTVVVAVQSGLASYDDSVFAVHAIQHILLMNVAPILYALSAPVTLALQSSSRPVQRAILRVLNNVAIEAVTHPVVVVVFGALTMLVYFLTPFYALSLRHPLLHDFSHLHFLVVGCLFWWLVIGLDPTRWHLSYPAKLGFLATGIPVGVIIGLTLTSAHSSVDPGVHSIADTHTGGAILWVVNELFTLVALAIVGLQWMRYEERAALRADRRRPAADAPAAGSERPPPTRIPRPGATVRATVPTIEPGAADAPGRPGLPSSPR
jgi:putative copper resistance protein D